MYFSIFAIQPFLIKLGGKKTMLSERLLKMFIENFIIYLVKSLDLKSCFKLSCVKVLYMTVCYLDICL